MFCYQCEQAAKGEACIKGGVCGKTEEVAALQDLLIYALQGMSLYAVEARRRGITDAQADLFGCEGVFSTLTNVNFDPERFATMIRKAAALRDSFRDRLDKDGAGFCPSHPAAAYIPAADTTGLVRQGQALLLAPDTNEDQDIVSLKHILLFGLKGVAAYADHAKILGQEDAVVYAFIQEALAPMTRSDMSPGDFIAMILRLGEVNIKAMELLDRANTGTYGHPVPTAVPLGVKKGKAILVSGHDLKDLEEILTQSEGKGINVYSHGEMLPCHAYPQLKKYSHFYGHYGTAWHNQQKEFEHFPGAIVMTTNCLQKPRASYAANVFSAGLVGWPGMTHIADRDFSPVIKRALALPGFPADSDRDVVLTGFARNAVMAVADTVVEAVKNKDIRHFFLVAGCDGAKPGRSYYTEFVEKVPADCVVLTLACGKFRFFDKKLGTIGALPRLLDIGQCNDAYSAIQIAAALAQAFDCEVNDLPLSFVLSWYEQKAVAIVLSLLSLGIKDIRLGPSLPAFISPGILQVLVTNFGIKAITTPDEDLAAILGPAPTAQKCCGNAA